VAEVPRRNLGLNMLLSVILLVFVFRVFGNADGSLPHVRAVAPVGAAPSDAIAVSAAEYGFHAEAVDRGSSHIARAAQTASVSIGEFETRGSRQSSAEERILRLKFANADRRLALISPA
jgi:hypothetical protein